MRLFYVKGPFNFDGAMDVLLVTEEVRYVPRVGDLVYFRRHDSDLESYKVTSVTQKLSVNGYVDPDVNEKIYIALEK